MKAAFDAMKGTTGHCFDGIIYDTELSHRVRRYLAQGNVIEQSAETGEEIFHPDRLEFMRETKSFDSGSDDATTGGWISDDVTISTAAELHILQQNHVRGGMAQKASPYSDQGAEPQRRRSPVPMNGRNGGRMHQRSWSRDTAYEGAQTWQSGMFSGDSQHYAMQQQHSPHSPYGQQQYQPHSPSHPAQWSPYGMQYPHIPSSSVSVDTSAGPRPMPYILPPMAAYSGAYMPYYRVSPPAPMPHQQPHPRQDILRPPARNISSRSHHYNGR